MYLNDQKTQSFFMNIALTLTLDVFKYDKMQDVLEKGAFNLNIRCI